jgi:hypothetical protein
MPSVCCSTTGKLETGYLCSIFEAAGYRNTDVHAHTIRAELIIQDMIVTLLLNSDGQ